MYLVKKGFTLAKPKKRKREKFLSSEDVEKLLAAVLVENAPKSRRDHAAIFLGYYLGLRAGETAILERETFRDIEDGVVHVRTLKQGAKIPFHCRNCGKKTVVALNRAGKPWRCRKCDTMGEVSVLKLKDSGDRTPPEKEPPMVEDHVVNYVRDYMQHAMRPDQRWLIEGRPGEHLSTVQLRNIFNTYLDKAGLPNIYSWHSLRHGRGVLLWEKFGDPVIVRDMLRQKSISSAEIYMHLSPARAEELKKRLDSAAPVAANPNRKL
jgi:integrase